MRQFSSNMAAATCICLHNIEAAFVHLLSAFVRAVGLAFWMDWFLFLMLREWFFFSYRSSKKVSCVDQISIIPIKVFITILTIKYPALTFPHLFQDLHQRKEIQIQRMMSGPHWRKLQPWKRQSIVRRWLWMQKMKRLLRCSWIRTHHWGKCWSKHLVHSWCRSIRQVLSYGITLLFLMGLTGSRSSKRQVVRKIRLFLLAVSQMKKISEVRGLPTLFFQCICMHSVLLLVRWLSFIWCSWKITCKRGLKRHNGAECGQAGLGRGWSADLAARPDPNPHLMGSKPGRLDLCQQFC